MGTVIPSKRYKLKLNSIEKIEELLQQLYNEADKLVCEVQDNMNKLSSSVNLNEEILDAKTKFAKSINDFLSTKVKAIEKKMEIAKLMTDIQKFNGNVKEMVEDTNFDWSTIREDVIKAKDSEPKTTTYTLK